MSVSLPLLKINKNLEGKMPIVNLSLQIVPVVPEDQLYPVVDKVITYIASQNIPYEVGPMETTMEGELEVLLPIVMEVQKICMNLGINRVLSVIKIDYRRNGITMNEKVQKYREK
jgi:uncharacterized protein YqgV (UPF0045/DUF77 family)